MNLSVYVFDDDYNEAVSWFDKLVDYTSDSVVEKVVIVEKDSLPENKRIYELQNPGGKNDEIEVTFSKSYKMSEVEKEIAETSDFGDLVLVDDCYEDEAIVGDKFGQEVIFPLLIKKIIPTPQLMPVFSLWTKHWGIEHDERMRSFTIFKNQNKEEKRFIWGMGKSARDLLDTIIKVLDLKKATTAVTDNVEKIHEGREKIYNHIRSLGLIGESKAIKKVYDKIEIHSKSKNFIHLYGETGTGKTIAAEIIHKLSDINEHKFIHYRVLRNVDAGIIANEIFGCAKNAHNRAFEKKQGVLEKIGKGTLFIDDIQFLPKDIQSMLLGALDPNDRWFAYMGDPLEKRKFEGRLITASSEHLLKIVERGDFIPDLFYRITGATIYFPSLKEHGQEEIRFLVNHFLAKKSQLEQKFFSINNDAMDMLCACKWVGNTRLLENAVNAAIGEADGNCCLTTSDFVDFLVFHGINPSSNINSVDNNQDPACYSSIDTPVAAYVKAVIRYMRKRGKNTKTPNQQEVGLNVAYDLVSMGYRKLKDGQTDHSIAAAFIGHVGNNSGGYAAFLCKNKNWIPEEVINFFLEKFPIVKMEYKKFEPDDM